MLFVDFNFLSFFLIVLGIHWSLRGERSRKLWLLAASYFFYGAWDWRFLGLIFGSTLVDYCVGLGLEHGRRRRAWLGLSLVANLGLLGFFKYFGFFVDSGAALLRSMGFEAHPEALSIVLPVGISFYTFQTLSYSIDVYRGRLKPTHDFADFALFVAFFPQLVAGPIIRAVDFLPQLKKPRVFSRTDVRAALLLFLVGFIKKACISDGLSGIPDEYFANPGLFDVPSAWLGTLFYALQIYCDFSGYSDMAIACAALLGYRLMINFRFPYLAADITDFWRRWHISLSSWLRDYLYIPLGGNRGSLLFKRRNLLITMLLGGLWHGAGWNFVLWGALHGLALIVHSVWQNSLDARGVLRRSTRLLGPVLTLWFVSFCWIFFRATSLSDGLIAARAFSGLGSSGGQALASITPFHGALLLLVFLLAHLGASRQLLARFWGVLPGWMFALVLGVLVALALPFVPLEAKPFIYFQF